MILQPLYNTRVPRTIRIENIFKNISEHFEVHVQKFIHPSLERDHKYLISHNLGQSSLGNIINLPYRQNNLISSRNLFLRIVSFVFKRFFLSPDVWIVNHDKVLSYFQKRELPEIKFIYASIKPFSNAKLAYKLKELKCFKNSKIILDIGDPLTYNAMNFNKINQKFLSFEKKYLGLSDLIVVTNKLTKDHYIEKFNLSPEKIKVIPQGVDLNLFNIDPKPNSNLTKIKLVYAGIFYEKLRSPEFLLQAIDDIEKTEHFQIDLYGSNINVDHSCINVHESITQNKLAEVYKTADALLFFDNAFGIQLSGKIYELLATRKPIIFIYSNTDSEALQMVSKYDHIIKVQNNLHEIRELLKNIIPRINEIQLPEYDISQFSWKNRAEAFLDCLKEIS